MKVHTLRLPLMPRMPRSMGYVHSYLIEVSGKVVLVDAGCEQDARTLLRLIKEFGFTPDIFALTHCHIDHVRGLAALARAFPGMHLLAAKQNHALLAEGRALLPKRIGHMTSIRPILAKQTVLTRIGPVTVHGDLGELAELGIEVLSTPGHADCHHSFVVAGEGVLVGDTLSSNNRGQPMFNVFHDDRQALVRSLRSLGDVAVPWVYPSHGGRVPRERFLRFLKELD